METNMHPVTERKTRNQSEKRKDDSIKVVAAHYLNDFSVAVTFSCGSTQLINFLPLFEKHVEGDNLKYFSPERFKQFIVKDGNIYWGKNEDVIFPVSLFFKDEALQAKTSEEILYIN